jgi:tetratricopeptide (TPR) repeat protein
MERLMRKTVLVAEQLGLGRLLAVSHNALANALWRLGRLDEALTLVKRAQKELETQGDARIGGICLQNLARIHLTRGELDEAQGYAEEAVQTLSAIPRFHARALALLALVKLELQQPQQALTLSGQALAILTRLGRVGTDEAIIRLAYVRALLGMSDEAAAREAVRVARERLLEQAAALTTEEARDDFLHRLPENAQLLSLAEQLWS